ncbi:MAG: hypothetical protein ABH875_01885, partial [Candidatus Omnitrophota bacterium]
GLNLAYACFTTPVLRTYHLKRPLSVCYYIHMLLDVAIVSTTKVIFNGQAKNVIVPGEGGVFEVLPFHKSILSRLISGVLILEDRELPIKRGVIQASKNRVTIIVEER